MLELPPPGVSTHEAFCPNAPKVADAIDKAGNDDAGFGHGRFNLNAAHEGKPPMDNTPSLKPPLRLHWQLVCFLDEGGRDASIVPERLSRRQYECTTRR